MRLVMTLLVRDEEDIVGANIEFHLRQGVDHFVVTDNLSVDRTAEVLTSYLNRGLVTLIFEPTDDYSQSQWVTRMARLAATELAADWVVNSDADEFWMPIDEKLTLKSALAVVDKSTLAIEVPRFNCPPIGLEDAGSFASRMVYREMKSFNLLGDALPPKVCHRALADVDIGQGNHSISRGGKILTAEEGPMRILHYPLRSYKQFENKIVKGGAACARNTTLPQSAGHVWRSLYSYWQERGELLEVYRRNVASPEGIQDRLKRADLVHDDRVAQVLSKPLRQEIDND